MRCLALFLLFYTASSSFHEEELYGPFGPQTTQRPNRPQQTRSLSGTPATDGNYAYNDELFEIMTLWVLKGYAIFKIKQYNDRVYLDRTRRSYWYGDRYYQLDNYYYLDTRDTCAYRMNETQRKNLYYEDGVPIFDIFYQCQRYVEFCCGLDCCKYTDMGRTRGERKPPKTPWDFAPQANVIFSFIFTFTLYFAMTQ